MNVAMVGDQYLERGCLGLEEVAGGWTGLWK